MFFDRYDAGKQLANKLLSYKDSGAVIIALPRGGVLVGYEISSLLHLPLDVAITRKIGHPFNREVAVCAITEDGKRVCDDSGLFGLDEAWVRNASVLARAEAKRRRQVFGVGRTVPITGKTVIVTDDGIATGLTIKAALLMIRAQKPKKIVLAIPVAPPEIIKELQTMVDEIVLLDTSKVYRGAVGAYYVHFPEVSDREVIDCLQSTRQTRV